MNDEKKDLESVQTVKGNRRVIGEHRDWYSRDFKSLVEWVNSNGLSPSFTPNPRLPYKKSNS